MKTTYDILDRLYAIVNVTAVKALLTGKVYRIARPQGSTKKDIVINTLPIKGDKGYELQEGTANVNIWVEKFDNGMPDEATLKALVAAVETAIKAGTSSNEYFDFQIESEDLIHDYNDPRWCYANIRVGYTIENIATT
jgi:hypothetical protein